MLSYFAGLRHDEVARLRLNHFQTYTSLYSDGQFGKGIGTKLRLKVTRGKTSNAARSLYLHLLADTDAIDQLIEILDSRQTTFQQALPANILMNGVANDRLGHQSNTLKKQVITALKGRLGKEIDVQTLRHNFTTWLILAYELAKNPEMAQYFNIPKDHPLFEPER